MLAGQRKIADDGKEVMLFPLEIMWMTQGEHNGYCMDFQGAKYNSNHQVVREYRCPLYAPCSCTCVARSTSGDWQIFTSDDVVHIPGRSTPVIITFQIGHDNTPQSVGDHFTQGDLIGRTGTNGQVTGDHLHYNIAIGTYQGWLNHQLKNSTHIYSACYVDDTVLYDDGDYNWLVYGETPPVPPPIPPYRRREKKFPWFIYSKRFRNGVR